MVGFWLSSVTVIDEGIDGCPVALWVTYAHSREAGGCAVVQQSGSNQLVHHERLTTNSREDSSRYLAISPLGRGEQFREKRRSLSSYRYGWQGLGLMIDSQIQKITSSSTWLIYVDLFWCRWRLGSSHAVFREVSRRMTTGKQLKQLTDSRTKEPSEVNEGSGAEREKGSERVTVSWRASLLQAGSYSTRRQARIF